MGPQKELSQGGEVVLLNGAHGAADAFILGDDVAGSLERLRVHFRTDVIETCDRRLLEGANPYRAESIECRTGLLTAPVVL